MEEIRKYNKISAIDSVQPSFPFGDGNFQASLPSCKYRKIISCFTQIRVIKNTRNWKSIFPEDGNTALIFRCDQQQPGVFIVGIPTHPREAEYVISGGEYFCAFFYPCMGYAFYNLPAIEITNRSLALNYVMPEESEQITERMIFAETFRERIYFFEVFLERRMPMLTGIPDQVIYNITSAIHSTSKLSTQKEFFNSGMYTSRHIRRLFQKYVGISPKLYYELLRHQNTLKILTYNPYYDMDELSLEAGYFDQSHFINTFKRFTDSTPSQFARDIIRVKKDGLHPVI